MRDLNVFFGRGSINSRTKIRVILNIAAEEKPFSVDKIVHIGDKVECHTQLRVRDCDIVIGQEIDPRPMIVIDLNQFDDLEYRTVVEELFSIHGIMEVFAKLVSLDSTAEILDSHTMVQITDELMTHLINKINNAVQAITA